MRKLAKTLLVAAVAGLTAAPAFSCSLMDSTTDTLRNIINQQGGYPISEMRHAECAPPANPRRR